MDTPKPLVTKCLAVLTAAMLGGTGTFAESADSTEKRSDRASEQALPSGVVVEDCVVRFAQEIDVPALEAGAVAELRVRQNQEVRRGELLARQDPSSLLIRKRSAQLQRRVAEEQLGDDLDLQYAQAARAEASAELEANRNVYNDANGAVPLSLLRKLRLAVERTDLEVARAEKQRRLAQIEVDLRSADLDLIENQLGRLQIESPVAGIVLESYAEAGEWVAAGEPVVRVARLDRVHVHALTSTDQLDPKRCTNQVVTVTWSENGQRRVLRGRVTSFDPELLANGRYRLHAEIDNTRDGAHWRLLPGTEVQMKVHPVAASDGARPPVSAVSSQEAAAP
ncbi:MAG: HlyD family efflux transporter periplasmic adaptor subunit [Pirellulaceae bacterium]